MRARRVASGMWPELGRDARLGWGGKARTWYPDQEDCIAGGIENRLLQLAWMR